MSKLRSREKVFASLSVLVVYAVMIILGYLFEHIVTFILMVIGAYSCMNHTYKWVESINKKKK